MINEFTRRIALFKSTQYGGINEGPEYMEAMSGYVRVSEYVEITFPPRQKEEAIAEELDQLDKAANEIRVKAQDALIKIEERRQSLLALEVLP